MCYCFPFPSGKVILCDVVQHLPQVFGSYDGRSKVDSFVELGSDVLDHHNS